ncbi:hypothetical protein J0J30_24075, partial [Vibrio vulnificus]|nr:hypothetical protein [Vibrio vulnificus]
QKQIQIKYLSKEIQFKQIENELQNPNIQNRISDLQNLFKQICSNTPSAFWSRKKHTVDLPYESNFIESKIPTRARPIQMSEEM